MPTASAARERCPLHAARASIEPISAGDISCRYQDSKCRARRERLPRVFTSFPKCNEVCQEIKWIETAIFCRSSKMICRSSHRRDGSLGAVGQAARQRCRHLQKKRHRPGGVLFEEVPRSVKEQINQDQDDRRDTENPRQEIFTHESSIPMFNDHGTSMPVQTNVVR